MEKKQYLTFLPVHDEVVAKLLRSEATWTVMNAIRNSGVTGISVDKIEEDTGEPKSTIYNILTNLEKVGFVRGEKERKKNLPKFSKGRPKKVYSGEWKNVKRPEDTKEVDRKRGRSPMIYHEACEKRVGYSGRIVGDRDNPWGDIFFAEKFKDIFENHIKKDKRFKVCMDKMESLMKDIYQKHVKDSSKKSFKDFEPTADICKECEKCHEGYEFFKALAFLIMVLYVESDDFNNILEEFGFKDSV